MQGSTGTVTSTSVLRLTYPRSKSPSFMQTVSEISRHFSGSRTTLNAKGSSGNSGSGRLVADKISIDPKTKLRMEIRKEAMNNSGAKGGNNSNSSGNKWTPAENWDPSQPGRYRQAYEENQNRSGYRPNYNSSSSGNRRQAQDARRPGRYYDERSGQNAGQIRGGQPNQQQRQNAPSSFATSSGFGFSAPTPPPKPAAPSSFATSGFGFSAPTKTAKATPASPPPKVNAQPNTPQKIKAETPKVVSPTPSTSSSPSTSGTTAGSTATISRTTQPTPKTSSPSSTPSSSSTQASSTVFSSQTAPPTFTKSTRSAKENAKRHVEQRSKQRKQRQKPAKDVFIPEAINVSNLAGLLGARMPHFERTMKAMGMEITRHDHSKYLTQKMRLKESSL